MSTIIMFSSFNKFKHGIRRWVLKPKLVSNLSFLSLISIKALSFFFYHILYNTYHQVFYFFCTIFLVHFLPYNIYLFTKKNPIKYWIIIMHLQHCNINRSGLKLQFNHFSRFQLAVDLLLCFRRIILLLIIFIGKQTKHIFKKNYGRTLVSHIRWCNNRKFSFTKKNMFVSS